MKQKTLCVYYFLIKRNFSDNLIDRSSCELDYITLKIDTYEM